MRMLSFLFVASTLWAARPAQACSCAPPGTPTEALTNADAVFRGTVTDIDEGGGCGGSSSADPVYVTLRVTTYWKGTVGKTTEVVTARDGASCGYTFKKGDEYLIYAHDQTDGDLQVGLCSRTRLVSEATEDLTELGAGTTAALDLRGVRRVRLADSSLLGLLLLGLAICRRR